MRSGLLLLDKPVGIYSGELLRRLKRRERGLKLGHAGTLDPLASGLLQVLVGEATKLVPYLEDDKEYLAGAVLGIATDSLDCTGRIEKRLRMPRLKREKLRRVLAAFVGEQMQRPPALSAKRVRGSRSYRLFRRGERLSLPAVPVEIHRLELLEYQHPAFSFRLHCSTGTYVRSLVRDIGEVLGGCASLYSLRRTRVGSFRVSAALKELAAWRQVLLSPQQVLPQLRGVRLSAAAERLARQGRELPRQMHGARRLRAGQLVCLLGPRGRMIGVAEVGEEASLRVRRVLN